MRHAQHAKKKDIGQTPQDALCTGDYRERKSRGETTAMEILQANLGSDRIAHDVALAATRLRNIDLLVIAEPNKKITAGAEWITEYCNMANKVTGWPDGRSTEKSLTQHAHILFNIKDSNTSRNKLPELKGTKNIMDTDTFQNTLHIFLVEKKYTSKRIVQGYKIVTKQLRNPTKPNVMPPEEKINRVRDDRRMEWTVTEEKTIISQEELKNANEKLKNNKAPGLDEITSESNRWRSKKTRSNSGCL
ncbi:hypothetical protein JTB14_017837 [Gonioctena quinquepunctata]|nr:hypothetical protein JTB14_017837 [Gonioctena quinquepunctata]